MGWPKKTLCACYVCSGKKKKAEKTIKFGIFSVMYFDATS